MAEVPPHTQHEQSTPGLWPDRYDLIDAWRGLAALAVCLHHVVGIHIGRYAVLVFFVISGYCIAASADQCRRKGYGFETFMMRRVRRIYPPYLFSLAFWAATRMLKWHQTGENELARPVIQWIQNITLTQWITLLFEPRSYAPTNPSLFVPVYWSLCYEEQFYILTGVFLLLAGRLRWDPLHLLLGFLAVGLAWNVVVPERSFGLFIEYWSLFAFGALVFYRLCRFASRNARLAVDLLLWVVLAGSIFMRWFSGHAWALDQPGLTPDDRESVRLVYEELTLAAAFALMLIYTRPISERLASYNLYKPLAWLGAITFSLYLIHQFNITLMRTVSRKLLSLASFPAPVPGSDSLRLWTNCYLTLQVMLHIALACVFWCFCERPFLNRKLPAKQPAESPERPPS